MMSKLIDSLLNLEYIKKITVEKEEDGELAIEFTMQKSAERYDIEKDIMFIVEKAGYTLVSRMNALPICCYNTDDGDLVGMLSVYKLLTVEERAKLEEEESEREKVRIIEAFCGYNMKQKGLTKVHNV